MERKKTEAVIEAILFAMGDSVELEKIAKAVEHDTATTRKILHGMMDRYRMEDRGVQIIELEDSFQMCTKKEMYEYLYPIFDKRSKPNLTQASMETLAIIAYNPKITRAEIEAIRGVNSDGTIYKLLEFNLIENVGKADLPGRPTMYATTPNFLKMFGMSSLEELPELPKYKLDENQQLVIDDIIPSEDQSTIEKEEIASDETISEAPMPERENVDVIKNDNI